MHSNINESPLKSSETSLWFKIKTTTTNCRELFKSGGFKAVFKRYGWKIFAAFFIYYLIRDSLIYIIIPYLVAKHLIS